MSKVSKVEKFIYTCPYEGHRGEVLVKDLAKELPNEIGKGDYYIINSDCSVCDKSVKLEIGRTDDLKTGKITNVYKSDINNVAVRGKDKKEIIAFRKSGEEYVEEHPELFGEKYKSYEFNYRGRKGTFFYHKPGVKNKNGEEGGILFVSSTTMDEESLERILFIKEKLSAAWITQAQKNYKKKGFKKDFNTEMFKALKRKYSEVEDERVEYFKKVSDKKKSSKYDKKIVKDVFKQEHPELYDKIWKEETKDVNEAELNEDNSAYFNNLVDRVVKEHSVEFMKCKDSYIEGKVLKKLNEKNTEKYKVFEKNFTKDNKKTLEETLTSKIIYNVPFRIAATENEIEFLLEREEKRKKHFNPDGINGGSLKKNKEKTEDAKKTLKTSVRNTPKRILRGLLYSLIPGGAFIALGYGIYSIGRIIKSLSFSEDEIDAYWKNLLNLPSDTVDGHEYNDVESTEQAITDYNASITDSEGTLDDYISDYNDVDPSADDNVGSDKENLAYYQNIENQMSQDVQAAEADKDKQWADVAQGTENYACIQSTCNWAESNEYTVHYDAKGYPIGIEDPNNPGVIITDPYEEGLIERGVDMPEDEWDRNQQAWDEMEEARAAEQEYNEKYGIFAAYAMELDEMEGFYSGRNTLQILLSNLNSEIIKYTDIRTLAYIIGAGIAVSSVLGYFVLRRKKNKLRKLSIGSKVGAIDDPEQLKLLYSHNVNLTREELSLSDMDDINLVGEGYKEKRLEEIVKEREELLSKIKVVEKRIPKAGLKESLEELVNKKKALVQEAEPLMERYEEHSLFEDLYFKFLKEINEKYYQSSDMKAEFKEAFKKLREALPESEQVDESDPDYHVSDFFISKTMNNRADILKKIGFKLEALIRTWNKEKGGIINEGDSAGITEEIEKLTAEKNSLPGVNSVQELLTEQMKETQEFEEYKKGLADYSQWEPMYDGFLKTIKEEYYQDQTPEVHLTVKFVNEVINNRDAIIANIGPSLINYVQNFNPEWGWTNQEGTEYTHSFLYDESHLINWNNLRNIIMESRTRIDTLEEDIKIATKTDNLNDKISDLKKKEHESKLDLKDKLFDLINDWRTARAEVEKYSSSVKEFDARIETASKISEDINRIGFLNNRVEELNHAETHIDDLDKDIPKLKKEVLKKTYSKMIEDPSLLLTKHFEGFGGEYNKRLKQAVQANIKDLDKAGKSITKIFEEIPEYNSLVAEEA